MNKQILILQHLSWIALLLLGCSTPHPKPTDLPDTSGKQTITTQFKQDYSYRLVHFPTEQSKQDLIANYEFYKQSLAAVKQGDTFAAANYINQTQSPEALKNAVRTQWLITLGKNNSNIDFNEQYNQLPEDARTQTLKCYYEQNKINFSKNISAEAKQLVQSTEKLPNNCINLIASAINMGYINKQDAWKRVWVELSLNNITNARTLANALGEPLPAKLGESTAGANATVASALASVITPTNRNLANAANKLEQLEFSGSLNTEQIAFANGILGLARAKDLKMQSALVHFNASNHSMLTKEQWEWYARSALRLSQWKTLNDIIMVMPQSLQEQPAWTYWRGRALSQLNDTAKAQDFYRKAANTGRNFYALLAQEELNIPINVNNNAEANGNIIQRILQDKNINQALVLFEESLNIDSREMRIAAGLQWRYAVKNFSEEELIASSQLAFDRMFYEMGIYSAEKTNRLLNFDLRYISPYKNITQYYAQMNNIDDAWVYGLIRQESRFMTAARSSVGASGLMQIMPGTARDIAKKIGLDSYNVNDLQTNIQMGTWYLSDIKQSLGSEVLATAGYNAGPGRARRWRANTRLEGAIYAETIPFNETRDYVKKVMANTAYYQALFGNSGSLKQRLGYIQANY